MPVRERRCTDVYVRSEGSHLSCVAEMLLKGRVLTVLVGVAEGACKE